ncbi:FecR domain-containing protein [Chitinophaga sp. 212800010-3]|uniref:FecR family protein n=1 Tax=unclassified Chitinophaga TaxID=2619133 RepID=UPI002DF54E43|nr:FecR family protein [Chitinophaga sp. 212800010-3]
MAVSRFRYLFNRYYTGLCTPEEKQEFLLMVEQPAYDEELKLLLDDLLLNADNNDRMPDDTADAMLQQIMQSAAPDLRVRRLFPWKKAVIAACVLVVAGIAGYKLLTRQQRHAATIAAQHMPRHKDEHARLVLDNGDVIDLEQDTLATVNVQSGVSASRNGNQLVYSNQAVTPTMNTVYTTKGGTYRVILPDGSIAWLNAASSIRFPTAFTDSIREVNIQGEVYFDVAAKAGQPFYVKAAAMKVAVLGTRFNIMAYEEENNICTSLLEGAVNIISGYAVKHMQPGQQALVNRQHDGISISNADVESAVAWKDGRFEFNGNIKSIMRELARWYDVQVVFEGEITNKSFGGSFSRQDKLADILEKLELTGSIHFKLTNNIITVSP